MTEIVIEGNQNSNLNSRQQNEARSFFASKLNGREFFCGLNSDFNKGCNKSITELLTIWEAKQISKGKKICKCGWQQLRLEHGNTNGNISKPKICPECKGVRRIEPILLVNEKSGNGLDRIVDNAEEKFGNVCLYCKSCQMIWDRRQDQSDLTPKQKENAEYTTIKSKAVRPNLPYDLKDVLSKENHICYEVVVNHWTTDPKYKCSQKLIQQVIKAWQGKANGFSIVNKDVYGFNCDYDICNGDHIVLTSDILNHKIKPIKSDYQAMIDTENDLKNLDKFVSYE